MIRFILRILAFWTAVALAQHTEAWPSWGVLVAGGVMGFFVSTGWPDGESARWRRCGGRPMGGFCARCGAGKLQSTGVPTLKHRIEDGGAYCLEAINYFDHSMETILTAPGVPRLGDPHPVTYGAINRIESHMVGLGHFKIFVR